MPDPASLFDPIVLFLHVHCFLAGGEPAECWTLAYDHCIPGYTSRNRLPRAVVYNEQRVRASPRLGGLGPRLGSG